MDLWGLTETIEYGIIEFYCYYSMELLLIFSSLLAASRNFFKSLRLAVEFHYGWALLSIWSAQGCLMGTCAQCWWGQAADKCTWCLGTRWPRLCLWLWHGLTNKLPATFIWTYILLLWPDPWQTTVVRGILCMEGFFLRHPVCLGEL